MHASSDLPQFGPRAVASRAPGQPEAPCPGALADMREAWEAERIWFTSSTSCAIDHSRASELDEARFVQVPRAQDLLHPSPEALGPASRVRGRYADMG